MFLIKDKYTDTVAKKVILKLLYSVMVCTKCSIDRSKLYSFLGEILYRNVFLDILNFEVNAKFLSLPLPLCLSQQR